MNDYRSLKDIAKTVRENLKAELPQWKFSVRVDNHIAISLSLMSGPYQVLESGDGYAELNPYTFLNNYGYGREEKQSNGAQLTFFGFNAMDDATKILAREHWDKSDTQTDYFCCAFYMHVNIGRWDKDYKVVVK
jgi:hypothetical protein